MEDSRERKRKVKTNFEEDLREKIRKFKHNHASKNFLTVLFPMSTVFNGTESLGSSNPNFKEPTESHLTKLYARDSMLSQHGAEKWLHENYFFGIHNGLIVESGALDGLQYSNTFMFETHLNWQVVHVEADPENFNSLRKNRHKSINVNAALCESPRLLHYLFGWTPATRGFVEFMSASLIRNYHEPIANKEVSIDELPTIPCLKFSTLMSLINVPKIDIWVLDVEGAEESVLLGTDFNKVRVDTIVMECDQSDRERDNKKIKILEKNSFTCQLISNDCICKHKSFKPSSRSNPWKI